MHASQPQASVTVCKAAGHTANIDQPDAVNTSLLDFAASVRAAA